jgi:tRNA splicing endonuclease
MLEIQIKKTENELFGIFDDIDSMFLLKKKQIYSTPIGTLSHSIQNKILGPPFLLNSLQLQYLYEKGLTSYDPNIKVLKNYKIFEYFTNLGYFVKDGMKFGCDFMIYPGDPLYCHSEALVCINTNVKIQRFVELTRIANFSNKKLLFVYDNQGLVIVKQVSWINTGPR